jgi:hypothetical protein
MAFELQVFIILILLTVCDYNIMIYREKLGFSYLDKFSNELYSKYDRGVLLFAVESRYLYKPIFEFF